MSSEKLDIEGIIRATRQAGGPQMVSGRQEAEAEVRQFLDDHAGRMTEAQAVELGKLMNRHWWGTGVRQDRFVPGLNPSLISKMVQDLDHFNQVTFTLWKGEEQEALRVADLVFSDRSYLPGSGRSYPSLILYLRFPDRYAIWFTSLDRGLAAITDYPGHGRSRGVESYLEFCSAVQSLREAHGLDAVEVDAVLAEASRRLVEETAGEREGSSSATLTREAFEFLRDLRDNNNKDWFDANRHRYEAHLRDPMAALFEQVAERYIRPLDPLLNTEVKRDQVLARMNKYSQGDPYYEWYWGAFSRGKKQEDVQLYININAEYLHFGLYLGSAPKEARERLAAEADEALKEYVDVLNQEAPDLVWWMDDETDIEIETVEDLAAWAAGSDPSAAIAIAPEDPIIGSSDLVDEIGILMMGLHPLAAIAWGDEAAAVAEPDESLQPDYSFDQLVEDTLLPVELLEEWLDLLNGDKRAGIFYGPPGTGKTFVVERLARHLAGDRGAVQTVQFHPSFSYEDFIEGLRPVMQDGQLGYEIRDGVFKKFCEEARGKDGDYVFVIDEINRAELGSVLGEVMMLVEYRGRKVPLPYSQRPFSIPRNVVLLATMNTADRSLALVDFALRRRFHAFRMPPNGEILQKYHGSDGELAVEMFDLVQEFVGDPDFSPGHTYWMVDDTSAAALERLWRYELRPYLEEYWFESRSRLDDLDRQVLTLLGEEA